MRKISSFTFITLNGFFEGPQKGDISWHIHGAEENEYAASQLQSGNTLLFGRITYEMMAGYWPMEAAFKNDPLLAAGMNRADKIVFSRTMGKPSWNNTRLISDNMIEEMKQLKQQPGNDMTLLGSGSTLTQFAENGLVDEFQVMVDPVVLGKGNTLFKDISGQLDLQLINSRTFKSGVILLVYQPVKKTSFN